MAGVSAYTGTQGSGKTYEVVANVILPAVAAGRRVVTNVAGLDCDAIYLYCRDVLESDNIGEIVSVSNDDVSRPNFFPVEESDPLFGRFQSIVKGGDVVILDEVWRWYATGEKLPIEHMKFIRMHRHFTDDATGVTCDVVLIVQCIDDLQRKVRGVVEKTFVMTKHKDLGLPNAYIVQIYQGSRANRKTFISDHQGTYKPEIYSLYKSHSQSKAASVREVDADRRGSVFNNWRIKFLAPLGLVMLVAAFVFMWRFFHPQSHASTAASSSPSPVSGSPSVASSAPVSVSRPPDALPEFRVIGSYTRGLDVVFLVVDSLGRVRKMANPVHATVTQFETRVRLPDGSYASTWLAGSDTRNREDAGGRDVSKLP